MNQKQGSNLAKLRRRTIRDRNSLQCLCDNSAPAPCSAHLWVSMCLNLQCPPEGGLYKRTQKPRCHTDSLRCEGGVLDVLRPVCLPPLSRASSPLNSQS